MSNSRPCCQFPQSLSDAESPFGKIIALDFYDGPTGGVLQCEACRRDYQFDMLDWDYRQVRIMRLRSLPPDSLEQCVALLSAFGPPHWPVWFPSQPASSRDEEKWQPELQRVLAQAKPAALVVAWLGYGQKLLAAKSMSPQALEDEPNWFSINSLSEVQDWFQLLGLVKGRDYQSPANRGSSTLPT